MLQDVKYIHSINSLPPVQSASVWQLGWCVSGEQTSGLIGPGNAGHIKETWLCCNDNQIIFNNGNTHNSDDNIYMYTIWLKGGINKKKRQNHIEIILLLVALLGDLEGNADTNQRAASVMSNTVD